MFILPADEEFSKEVDAWASERTSKLMENAKVVHKSKCIKKGIEMNMDTDINPITKSRECKYYGAILEDDEEQFFGRYDGNATCIHPTKKMANINASTCYCCAKNTIVLGQGFNGQGT